MMTTTVTLNELAAAVWGCKGCRLTPDDAVLTTKGWVYPDPSGPVKGADRYTNTPIHGWKVRMPTGAEEVTVTRRPDGNGVTLTGESWILDRTGHQLTGRDGKAATSLLQGG